MKRLVIFASVLSLAAAVALVVPQGHANAAASTVPKFEPTLTGPSRSPTTGPERSLNWADGLR